MENERSDAKTYLTPEAAVRELGCNNLITFDNWVKHFRIPTANKSWDILIHEYGYSVWAEFEPHGPRSAVHA